MKTNNSILIDKKALVTGSGRGIGKGLAMALARAGADIAVVDIDINTAKETYDEIKKMGRDPMYFNADLTRKENILSSVKKVVERFGRIDIAVNNIGNTGKPVAKLPPAEDIELESFNEQINCYLTSYFLLCQAEARVMIGQKSGHIINICSAAATRVLRGLNGTALAGMTPYCAAKAGVRQMSKVLAIEWAKYNINVNIVSPGYIITPANEKLIPEREKMYIDQTPMGRVGVTKDLDGAVVFLASEGSNWVTGHDLIVDGGLTL